MSDADTLARTIVGEARGEGERGMAAVACVVMNRAANPTWWGHTVTEVCKKPWQFSCWNEGDPNRAIIEGLNDGFAIYREARRIAHEALTGRLADITNGATHYYAASMKVPPKWAEGLTPCASVGRHLFFKDV